MIRIRTFLIATAVAAAAVSAFGQANAKAQIVATPIVKKLPTLNVSTHPKIPRICPNELSRGPGAKKCG